MPTKGRPGARIRIDPDLWSRYVVVAKAAGYPDRSTAVREFIERSVREYDRKEHFELKAKLSGDPQREGRLWQTGDPIV